MQLQPAQLVQGHTGVVRVWANRAGHVTGRVGEMPLGFVSTGEGEYVALVGAGALASTGSLSVRVSVQADGAQSVTLTATLELVAGHYDQEEIRFTPSVAKLLDPAITQPERLRLAAVFGTLSPRLLWKEPGKPETPFDWPIVPRVTSAFGTRRSYGGGVTSYHEGIDLGAETGVLVYAPAAGVVALAETLQVRGNAVILDHGAGLLSGYYHLDRISVRAGQNVGRGDVLGAVGSTGLATGSHLHWELRISGVPVDPKEWTERVIP